MSGLAKESLQFAENSGLGWSSASTVCGKALRGVGVLKGHGFQRLRKNFEIGDWGFERARLSAAPHIVFSDLRYGWEAVPFENSDAQSFFRNHFQPCRKSLEVMAGAAGSRAPSKPKRRFITFSATCLGVRPTKVSNGAVRRCSRA